MKITTLVLFLIISYNSNSSDLPKGWVLTGSNPGGYDTAIVSDQGLTPPVATIASNAASNDEGFGTVMQKFFPKEYLGKRVEMTVLIKSKNVETWSAAWLRVDDSSSNILAFDNMRDRPIKGTTDWDQYSIVLDIPQEAESINYGILLAGKGQVWFDEFNFEEVSDTIDVTGIHPKEVISDKPLNNSF